MFCQRAGDFCGFCVGDMFCHSSGYSLKSGGGGRFSSPLRNSKTVSFYHSSGYTPSVSHSLDSSLREGAGRGAYHSTYRPKTATLRAIFIAPTKLRGFWLLPFIWVHSLSLAFARQLPQRGSRGGAGAIQPAAQKPQRCGRFSSPLRKLGEFYISPSNRVLAKPWGFGRFSSPLRRLIPPRNVPPGGVVLFYFFPWKYI